jgi:hypothetical protein
MWVSRICLWRGRPHRWSWHGPGTVYCSYPPSHSSGCPTCLLAGPHRNTARHGAIRPEQNPAQHSIANTLHTRRRIAADISLLWIGNQLKINVIFSGMTWTGAIQRHDATYVGYKELFSVSSFQNGVIVLTYWWYHTSFYLLTWCDITNRSFNKFRSSTR